MEIKDVRTLEDIVISALRYALPRHTYILFETVTFIKENKELVTDRVKTVMIRDCEEQLNRYSTETSAVVEIDKKTIQLFYDWLLTI